MKIPGNPKIVCAYAVLFTVASGILALDFSSRRQALRDLPTQQLQAAAARRRSGKRAEIVGENVSPALHALSIAESRTSESPIQARESGPLLLHPRAGATMQKRLAPPGVFYVTARVSRVDAVGVHALIPGRAGKAPPAKGKASEGHRRKHDFELTEEQVTRDLDYAEELAKRHAAPQRLAVF
jgi:hypothetical protein